MHSKPIALLSFFALTTLSKPLGPIESIPDGAGGDAPIAAGDQLEGEHDNGKNWEIDGVDGPVYWPLSINGNTCVVHNMLGIHDEDKQAVKDCFANNPKLWGDQTCGGLKFTVAKDSGHWKNSQECYGANRDCINNAVDNGFGNVVCYTQSNGNLGSDSCKVEYHHDPPLPDGPDVRDPAKDPPKE